MFDPIIEDLEKLKKDIPHIINAAIHEREPQIIRLNQDQWYDHGLDAIGNPIWPEYQEYTIDMKEIRNRIPGHIYEPLEHVTLFQYGGFYAAMYIIYRQDEVVIWSRDPKTKELVAKYGREIFGITPENMPKLLTLVNPIIDRNIQLRLSNYQK